MVEKRHFFGSKVMIEEVFVRVIGFAYKHFSGGPHEAVSSIYAKGSR